MSGGPDRESDAVARSASTAEQEIVQTLEYLSDAFFALDDDLVVTYFNQAAAQLLGRAAVEVLGKPLFDAFSEARGSIFEINYRRAIQTKQPLCFETFFDRAPYRNWYDVRVYPRERGILIYFVVTTEKKQAEEALQALTQRLKLATESGQLGIWEWDVPNDVLIWDERMFELYGVAKDTFTICVEAWQSGVHPEDRARAIADCQAALRGERTFDTQFRVVHPSGAVKTLKANAVVIRDESGAPLKMIGLNRDITEQTCAEEEREELQGQLLQLQKMESVGRLAGGVAHDFNNMLGVILGHVEMALDLVPPSELLYTDLLGIQKAARRSSDLTRQLLAFARKQTIAPRVVDLNRAVEGALTMLGRLIGENIQLVWRPGGALYSIIIDPSQVDQVLTNLCINARDAIGGVGQLVIQTENVYLETGTFYEHTNVVPGDYVLLTVRDSGCGMDPATQEHIFEPFFSTKGLGQGTGLGLATVYGIIKQNNGLINVTSAPNEGTTFRIYFPRYLSDAESVALSESVPSAAAATISKARETILLVEDEIANLSICKKMLEKSGYRVLAAATPGQAIALAEQHANEIHLLMTDVIMPDMNGRELANKILLLNSSLKLLFVSGYSDEVISPHHVLQDGTHFLQKPFAAPLLLAKLREVLDR